MRLEDAYAQALFTELHKEKHERSDTILKHFKELVVRKGHASLFPRIARALERIETREARKNTVTIKTGEGRSEIPKEIISQFENSPVIGQKPTYEPCTDETLIGGYVASGKGVRVDASYKSALLSLYQSLKA